MKLIDRDELLRNIEADIDISVTGERNMEAVKCCLQNILDDVKESPVVDAVPVSFVEKKIEEYDSLADYEMNELGEFHGSALHSRGALMILLKEWAERKEDELR